MEYYSAIKRIDYILCSQRWRSSIQLAKTRPGADCGSDRELLVAKFRLKKVGKTTRPFRYDLNQIPYNYTVEVKNRFKGLDLIDRVPDELWTEIRNTVLEIGIKTIRIIVCICQSLEKAMAPHSSTLAWKIPWTEKPGRLWSMGYLRVGHD